MTNDISNIRICLDAEPDLKLALLFGSTARAAAGPNSDVDVAVLAEQPLTAQRRLQLIQTLSAATGRPVDLVDLNTAGLPMLRTALTTSQVLLNRDPAAYGRLISRFLIDSADFLPYRQRILDERRAAWIA